MRPGRQTGSFQGVIALLTSCLLTTIRAQKAEFLKCTKKLLLFVDVETKILISTKMPFASMVLGL